MIGIFVLYMTDFEKGGLNFDREHAADIFGTFIALNYLTPFIGGLLADRLLGYRRSIILGGSLMGLGYLCLAISGMPAFYTAISRIADTIYSIWASTLVHSFVISLQRF